MYIVFEGMVGSGKSTQSKKLLEYLQEKYPEKEVILVREPGSTIIAQEIRLLAQSRVFEEEMDSICEAYLYAASRAQSLRHLVRPTLDAGGIVISDRSFISSLAFQGEGRGVGLDRILEINHRAIEGILPDLVIHLYGDIAHSLARTSDSTGDKFEKMGVDFFEKVDRGYRKASELPILQKVWMDIDGRGTIEEVFERIIEKTAL